MRKNTLNISITFRENEVCNFYSKSQCYIARSPYGENRYLIHLKNDRYVCSCRSTGLCAHILAVFAFNGIDLTAEDDPRTYKLSVLMRRKRGKEGKSGRKKPRPSDISQENVIEADDSILAGSKKGPMTSTPKGNNKEKAAEKRRPEKSGATGVKSQTLVRPTRDPSPVFDDPDEMFQIPSQVMIEINVHDEGMMSLRPGKDIGGFVMDDIITDCIKNANLESSILLVDTFSYRLVANTLSGSILDAVNFLGKHEAFNKDFLLVNINTDPVSSGSHWLLGVVAFAEKTVIVLDSLEHVKPDMRREQYKNLLILAMISASIAGQPFAAEEWTCLFSRDCPRQPNGYDCGLFTTTTACCIIAGKRYVRLRSDLGRKWMLHVTAQLSKPVYRSIPARQFDPSAKLVSDVWEKLVALDDFCVTLRVITANTTAFTMNLVAERAGWTICSATTCVRDESHNHEHLMCVACRQWFHDVCVSNADVSAAYFRCVNCLSQGP